MPDPNPEDTQTQTSDPASSGEGSQMFSEPEDLDEPAGGDPQESSQFGSPEDEFEDKPSSEDQISDGTTDPESEPRSEEKDSDSDPGAEADDATTSEQSEAEAGEEDQDVDDETDSEDADDTPYFEGEESVYKTEDEALRGIEEKDRYISDLEEKVENTQSQAKEKVNNLQSELEQKKQEVERLRSAVDDETREDLAIQDYLPERFQGKTEADFADDEELVEFREAKLDAKAELRHEQKQQQKQQEQMQQQIAQAHQEAKEFVEERVDPEEFGATSPERKAKLRDFLEDKSENQDYTKVEKAQFIVAAFGQEDGERFLSGLQAEFGGSRSNTSNQDTSSNQNPEENRSEEEDEVAEQIKKSKTSPGAPETKPRTDNNEMSRREEMDHAFRRSAEQQGIQTP